MSTLIIENLIRPLGSDLIKGDRGFNNANVGKGDTYLFFGTIVSMISGYVFWFSISKLTTTDVVGAVPTLLTSFLIA